MDTGWCSVHARRARRALALVLLAGSSIGGACGCAAPSAGPRPEVSLPAEDALQRYVHVANHLTEEQKEALLGRRPFVGMTPEEARLTMRPLQIERAPSGEIQRGVYLGAERMRYHVDFGGKTPRVVFWSRYGEDAARLPAQRDRQPDIPLSLPPRPNQ